MDCRRQKAAVHGIAHLANPPAWFRAGFCPAHRRTGDGEGGGRNIGGHGGFVGSASFFSARRQIWPGLSVVVPVRIADHRCPPVPTRRNARSETGHAGYGHPRCLSPSRFDSKKLISACLPTGRAKAARKRSRQCYRSWRAVAVLAGEWFSVRCFKRLLLKLGEAKARYQNAWRLLDFELPESKNKTAPATFSFRLNRKKLREARRREGRYLGTSGNSPLINKKTKRRLILLLEDGKKRGPLS